MVIDYELEEFSIFNGYLSAGAYSYSCLLFIFHFGDSYFGYHYNSNEQKLEWLNTKDEVYPFFEKALNSELEYFELEKENLKNEYWEGEDVFIDFQVEIPY